MRAAPRRASSLLVAALLAACASEPAPHASQPAREPQSARDPQAAFEPRSEPGDGQRFLQRMEGDWTVRKTIHRREGGTAVTDGTCRQAMIHAGRFLQSEFRFRSADGAETTGTGLIGFDAEGGLFTSCWMDSRSTRMSFRRSPARFANEEIVLESVAHDEGATRRSRTTTRFDGEHRIVHRQVSIDAEGQERLVMELDLERRAQG